MIKSRTFCWLSVLTLSVGMTGGCDQLGIGNRGMENPNYSLKGPFPHRIHYIDEDSYKTSEYGSSVNLTFVAYIRPPKVNGRTVSSTFVHPATQDDRIYIAYKTIGSKFGGGVDILQLRGESNDFLQSERHIAAKNVDVQQVVSNKQSAAFYSAGAIVTRKEALSPAILTRLKIDDGQLNTTNVRLSDFVAKSVYADAESRYAVTDGNSLFRFNRSLEGHTQVRVREAEGFRSLSVQGDNIYVLDGSGQLFRVGKSEFSDLTAWLDLTQESMSTGSIARLHTFDGRLFASMNEEGFAIVDPSSEKRWTSWQAGDYQYYRSVATYYRDQGDLLFTAVIGGDIDVWDLPGQVPDTSQTLDQVGTFNLLSSSNNIFTQRVTHLAASAGYLFIAASTDGTLILRID